MLCPHSKTHLLKFVKAECFECVSWLHHLIYGNPKSYFRIFEIFTKWFYHSYSEFPWLRVGGCFNVALLSPRAHYTTLSLLFECLALENLILNLWAFICAELWLLLWFSDRCLDFNSYMTDRCNMVPFMLRKAVAVEFDQCQLRRF